MIDFKKHLETKEREILTAKEQKALIPMLSNYVSAFEWELNYHKERMINIETGEINEYHEKCYNDVVKQVEIRERIAKSILNSLDYFGTTI